MEMIRKGKTGEGNRVRDFADMCFFTETSEERFETLLPKLYGEPEKTVKDHILLENDGQLKGLILPQTMIWKAGDRELLTGHIGTVCVSPDYRERGGYEPVNESGGGRAGKGRMRMHCAEWAASAI